MSIPLQILKSLGLVCVVFSLSACTQTSAEPPNRSEEEAGMQIRKLTPVLLAEDVAACVSFWTELGFETSMTIPADDGIAFAMMTNGSTDLMYQSTELATAQNANVAEGAGRAILYFDVGSLDPITNNIDQYDVVVPENVTDYGAKEIYVRDPAGHVIGFAEQSENEQ